jgi:hypothetical protein
MHMSINALHFYDRNCVACTERQPVRLPNLTQLVAERDAKLSANANAHAAHAARDSASRERRASGRGLSRVSASLQSADVLELLDVFDAQPNQANASLLVESARAVPSAFTGAVLAHLYEVADAGGADRTTGALAVLDLVSPDRVIYARIALRALARGEAVIEAARVFATCLAPAGQTPTGTLSSAAQVALDVDASLIPELDAALPTLVSLAAPKRGWRPWEVERPAHPSGFLAALQLLPAHAHIALRRALRSEHAVWRTAGAHVVVAVFDAMGIADALPFTADLIAGFSLPEDRHGDNHAMRTLAWALAELMQQAPTEIEGALARAAALGGVRERLGVVRTYVAVLEGHDERSGRFERRAERQVRDREPTAAEALAHQHLIETLASLPEEDEVVTALEAVFRDGRSLPEALLARVVPTALGVVALAATARSEGAAVGSAAPRERIADPRPAAVQGLDKMVRDLTVRRLSDLAMSIVANVGAHASTMEARHGAITEVLTMLAHAPADAELLRATLVTHCGDMITDPGSAALILPAIYRAMMDGAPRVRAAATKPYAALVRRLGPEGVPTLLHDTFLVLVSDPYRIVHGAALDLIDQNGIPDSHLNEACRHVTILLEYYSTAKDLAMRHLALRTWMTLQQQRDAFSPARRRIAVRIAATLSPNDARRYVEYNRSGLRGTNGYADLVLTVLGHDETTENAHDVVLAELATLEHAEIQRIAPAIAQVGRALLQRFPWHLERLVQVLGDAGSWVAAQALCAHAVASCSETREMRSRRLNAEYVAEVVNWEAAAAAHDVDGVHRAAAAARAILTTAMDERAQHSDDNDIQRLLRDASLFA